MDWVLTDFYQELIEQYSQITVSPPCEDIAKIGKHINFYLADQKSQLVTVNETSGRRIFELDIKGAFPTICRNLLGEDSEFVKKMDSIDEKKGKNIFIATTLKESGLLKQLNNICKIIVIGILFDTPDVDEKNEIFLFEVKKDSCGFSCNEITTNRVLNLDRYTGKFTRFIWSKGFRFHLSPYKVYVRSNRTSFFLTDSNEMIVKGQYKHIPSELCKIIKNILIRDEIDHNLIRKIYNRYYWNIIRSNNLMDSLEKYFICDNKKVIDFQGRYKPLNQSVIVDPIMYLKLFLYPIILSTKLK